MNSRIYQKLFFLLLLLSGAHTGFAQCVDNGNYWNNSWESCQVSPNPNPLRGSTHWILYEFEQEESIDSSRVWNANRNAESAKGAQQVIVDYSIDGTTWIELGTYTFPQASELTDYEGFEGPVFGGVFMKKILITIVSTYGDPSDCASLSEIRFQVEENACYGELDECGVCNGNGKTKWFVDADGDGFGSVQNTVIACSPPAGYVSDSTDYCDNGIPGWDQIGALFAEKGCTGCHGANATGGLNLTTYATTMLGGNKFGASILTGSNLVGIISIPNYQGAGAGQQISFPPMNTRVGGTVTAAELAEIQTWVDAGAPEDCNCGNGAPDVDNDGFCDAIDACPNLDNSLIGTSCNDGDACTENDVWVSNCNCVGKPTTDSDFDGICDLEDLAPADPCTADGVVDGNEPPGWVALPTNDCDADAVSLLNGDQNDFEACITDVGQSLNPDCLCPGSVLVAAGSVIGSSEGTTTFHGNANGLPDGSVSGSFNGSKYIELEFPYLYIGDEICIAVGFNSALGIVNFDVNNESFSFGNATLSTDYTPQNFCFAVRNEGIQRVRISLYNTFGSIKVDGSSYSYCECTDKDPLAEAPDCKCPAEKTTDFGQYVSSIGSISNATAAGGAPNGTVASSIASGDTLTLNLPGLTYGAEVCMSVGFTSVNGIIGILHDGNIIELPNVENAVQGVQEYCFVSETDGDTRLVIFRGNTSGSIKIDGVQYEYCPAAPGRTAENLALWLDATNMGAPLPNGTAIATWEDRSFNNHATTGLGPVYSTSATDLMNYNPVLSFDGVDDRVTINDGLFGAATYTDAHIFLVHKLKSAPATSTLLYESLDQGFIAAHLPWDDGNAHWDAGQNSPVGRISASSGLSAGDRSLWSLLSHSGTTAAQSIRKNGKTLAADANALTLTGNNAPFSLGALQNGGLPAHVDIGEFIAYIGNDKMETEDIHKVESYLALKYGLTLNNDLGGTAGDYVNSKGQIIWDASQGAMWHHDVIGIGRDDASGLLQKQSITQDDSLILYVDALQGLNAANTGTITHDHASILIGHNNGLLYDFDPGNSPEQPAGIVARMDREWKITNTNFSDNFSLEFNWNETHDFEPGNSFDISRVRLLMDGDGDFSDAVAYGAGDVIISQGSIIISGISTNILPINSTRYISIGYASSTVTFPTELTLFDAVPFGDIVRVKWQTASELNNDYFTVERSTDALVWESLAQVDGAGTSTTRKDYRINDPNPYRGISYYRLRQTDFDGHFTHSPVVSVLMEELSNPDLLIYPNPVYTQVTIQGSVEAMKEVRIFHISGQEVTGQTRVLNQTANTLTLDMSGLVKGLYLARTEYGSGEILKR